MFIQEQCLKYGLEVYLFILCHDKVQSKTNRMLVVEGVKKKLSVGGGQEFLTLGEVSNLHVLLHYGPFLT